MCVCVYIYIYMISILSHNSLHELKKKTFNSDHVLKHFNLFKMKKKLKQLKLLFS